MKRGRSRLPSFPAQLVIPAKAGIQEPLAVQNSFMPFLRKQLAAVIQRFLIVVEGVRVPVHIRPGRVV